MSDLKTKFAGFFAPSETSPAKEIVFQPNQNPDLQLWLPKSNQGYTGKLELLEQDTQPYFTQKVVAGNWEGKLELVMSILKLIPSPSGGKKLVNANKDISDIIFDDGDDWHISKWDVVIIDKNGVEKADITPNQGDLICDILTWQNKMNETFISKQAWPHYP